MVLEIMIEFFQNLEWMMLLRCFVVGGLICVVGQILIDKTKLTPARILVIFVTTGAILGGLRNLRTFSKIRWCRCHRSTYWFWKRTSKRCY